MVVEPSLRVGPPSCELGSHHQMVLYASVPKRIQFQLPYVYDTSQQALALCVSVWRTARIQDSRRILSKLRQITVRVI
jgi:hypothetical protein